MDDVIRRTAAAASELLEALSDDQRQAACLPFDDEAARRDWSYVPRDRAGLSLASMGPDEAKRAYRLLATGLSTPGFAQAATIVALEDVLDEQEAGSRGRHHRDYAVTVFGEPGDGRSRPWGWRFEGHHLSVNVTVAAGELNVVPLFLGANPAEVTDGRIAVVRPLPAEELLARALVQALPADQRRRAVLDDRAPDDILTGDAASVEGAVAELEGGVAAADLGGEPASILKDLVGTYVDRLPEPLALETWKRLEPEWEGLRFAWAGEVGHRRPHYYRLQAPGFLVEYDNTQNGANHVHTVVRDPSGDFGADLLRRHLHENHS